MDEVGPPPDGDSMKSKRFWTVLFLCSAMLFSHGCASAPPPSPVELGEAALATGDWRSAKTRFAEALRADPRSGRAWLGQSRAQLAGRDPEGSLRSLSSLSKVDRALFSGDARSTYMDALEGATHGRLEREQSEAALVAVRALVKLEPDRRGLDRLLGRTLVAEAERRRWLGDRERALSLYREACQVVPHTLEAWVGAAEMLLERKQGKEAMRLLEAARKTHPTAGQIRTLTIQALDFR
jgi:tetratricopeptide (TPR) repeat protein